MLTLELSTIQAKDLDRSELAAAMEAFERSGGEIQSLGSYGVKPKDVTWRNDGFYLPNSSQNTLVQNKELALLAKVKDLIESGAGRTSIIKSLGTNGRATLDRLRDKYELVIPVVRTPGVIIEKTRSGREMQRLRHREELAKVIRPMVIAGASLNEMAAKTGSCKRTLKRVIEEFKLGEGK